MCASDRCRPAAQLWGTFLPQRRVEADAQTSSIFSAARAKPVCNDQEEVFNQLLATSSFCAGKQSVLLEGAAVPLLEVANKGRTLEHGNWERCFLLAVPSGMLCCSDGNITSDLQHGMHVLFILLGQ